MEMLEVKTMVGQSMARARATVFSAPKTLVS
jgi:hypothetical protein